MSKPVTNALLCVLNKVELPRTSEFTDREIRPCSRKGFCLKMSDKKSDMERIGLFQEMSYVTVGDPFVTKANSK